MACCHLPTTIWYLIFCYAPMFGVIIAFKNYVPAPGVSFIPEIWQGHVNNGEGFWTALERLESWF